VKFRRDHPQQGRQIEVGYLKFLIFNQYFKNTDTEYRTDMKNTDENTEFTEAHWAQAAASSLGGLGHSPLMVWYGMALA